MLGLNSCVSEDELKYSCDEEVNSWIANHKAEISTMSRQDWLNAAPILKTGLLRAFSSEQLQIFWEEKFEEVKRLPWSKKEINHIEIAQNFIKEHIDFFEDQLTDDQLDDLETFFYKWSKIAIKELGWTEQIVGSITMTGLKVKDTKGNVEIPQSYNFSPLKSQTTEKDCNCSAAHDFCETFECKAPNSGCNTLERGCGWLCLQACTGTCGGL